MRSAGRIRPSFCPCFRRRRSVAQGAVRPDLVVVASPSLDQHFRLLQRVEGLGVEKLVPELAVEALVVAVLPGAAGLDEQGLRWIGPS
jgi:hypothetical protein